MGDEILTTDELSQYFKIPRDTVYRLARKGAIPATKVGRHWRFKKERIDSWFSTQEVPNSQQK